MRREVKKKVTQLAKEYSIDKNLQLAFKAGFNSAYEEIRNMILKAYKPQSK